VTEDRAVGAPERLHAMFLLTGLGSSLRGLAGMYAVIAYLAVTGRLHYAAIGIIGLIAFSAVGLFLYWRRFEYRVGTTEIRIDSGILSRTHRSIPFDRIQDVDITQGPVARLLGLAQVRFETGASAGAVQDEGVLKAITLERAEQLRGLIRSRRGSEQVPAAVAEAGESEPIYAMAPSRLLLAGIFNFSLALFAGLFGAFQFFDDFLGVDPFSRAFWIRLLAASGPLQSFIIANQLAAALGGLLLLALVGIATGIVRTMLRDYGFRLDRVERGFRRRRGLLTRTDVTLPIKRIQAAIVGSGPVRDAFGFRDLKLQNLARDEKHGDHVVAPLARDEEVDRIVGEIGWPPVSGGSDWQPISRAHVWTLVAAMAPLILFALLNALAAAAASALPADTLGQYEESRGAATFTAIALLLVVVAAIAVRWLAWRRTAYALDRDRILVRGGWWNRRLLVLPLARIQSIDIQESFVSRWFGISNMLFGVAGGRGFSAHQIPALPRETARHLREQLIVSMP